MGMQLTLWSDENDPIDFSRVRRVWYDGQWRFSVVDIIAVLISRDYQTSRKYWKNLKAELKRQGADELVTNPYQLKMEASDGKRYKTDTATEEQILRIIQSVPSPRAEPFKRWLARVAAERLEEERNPELGVTRSIDRATRRFDRLGRPQTWTNDRLQGILTRKEFMDALTHALAFPPDGRFYGQATNEVYRGVFRRDAQGLRRDLELEPRQNIRDYLTRPALHALGLAESLCMREFDASEPMTTEDALAIIHLVASAVGISVEELERRLGMDIVTGRRLLGPTDAIRGI